MSAGHDRATSARRRRDRQLRAWHRHVRTTVAMELATALHRSAQRPKSKVVEGPSEGEVRETYDALRRQKALRSSPRKWSGVMLDPERQMMWHATVGYRGCRGTSPGGGERWQEDEEGGGHHRLQPPARGPRVLEEEAEGGEGEASVGGEGEGEGNGEGGGADAEALSERIRHDMPLIESEWAAWYRWQASSSSSGRKRKKEEEEETSSRWPRSSSTTAVLCPWLVLLFWCSSRCIPFVCRQDSVARHYGRYGPERQYSSCARRRFRHMQGWFC